MVGGAQKARAFRHKVKSPTTKKDFKINLIFEFIHSKPITTNYYNIVKKISIISVDKCNLNKTFCFQKFYCSWNRGIFC